MEVNSEKVTYNFGVKLVGSTSQNLVNSSGVFVDDESKASAQTEQQQTLLTRSYAVPYSLTVQYLACCLDTAAGHTECERVKIVQ